MPFYCPYCNRDRSGEPNTPEAQTREHFIPQAIGGRWTVSICDACNSIASRTSDPVTKEMFRTFRFHQAGMLEGDAVAILLDGIHIPVYIRLQEVGASPGDDVPFQSRLHECVHRKSREPIDPSSIHMLRFAFREHIDADPDRYTAVVSKIVLGAAYYLCRTNGHWPHEVESFFREGAFNQIRDRFLGSKYKPGIRRDPDVRVESIQNPSMAQAMLRGVEDLTQYVHHVTLRNMGDGTQISVCLHSVFFTKVTLMGEHIPVPPLAATLPLRFRSRVPQPIKPEPLFETAALNIVMNHPPS